MITKVPNPVLTALSQKVTKIDKKILSIVEEMKKTLISTDNPKGVGLAAPQIGLPLAIFITKPNDKSPIGIFMNPEITWKSSELSEIVREGKENDKRKEKKLEGCLSIPEVWGYLRRPSKVRLKYMGTDGKTREEEFTGFMATIVQHETDHINGILFTHRVMEQKERLYKIELNEKGEDELVEIEI